MQHLAANVLLLFTLYLFVFWPCQAFRGSMAQHSACLRTPSSKTEGKAGFILTTIDCGVHSTLKSKVACNVLQCYDRVWHCNHTASHTAILKLQTANVRFAGLPTFSSCPTTVMHISPSSQRSHTGYQHAALPFVTSQLFIPSDTPCHDRFHSYFWIQISRKFTSYNSRIAIIAPLFCPWRKCTSSRRHSPLHQPEPTTARLIDPHWMQ